MRSLQMFIEQLVCRRLKVQVGVSITALLWCVTTCSVCLSRTWNTVWIGERVAFNLCFKLLESDCSFVLGVI